MKSIVLLAAAVLASAAFAEMKIGTVDMQKLLRNHSTYDSNTQLLKTTEKDYTQKIDRIKSELEDIQEEGKKLLEQHNNPMLAQAEKAKLEKQLTEIQNKLMSGQQRMRQEMARSQQELQDLEGRLVKATAESLRKFITQYAEKEGFDLILDRTAAPYSAKKLDVTDGVLKVMGVDPATAKGTKVNEGK